jgi:DNA-directed RNA polymerase subunit K/omega
VRSEENKEVVISLREIAAGYIKPEYPAGEDARQD